MKVSRPTILIVAAAALGALLLMLALLRLAQRKLAPEEVSERIITTIQREARESLLVTGSVDVTATVTIENAKRLLPGILNINLGTSRATVQVAGRAYYGFDVRELDARRISIRGDTIYVSVPAPRVLSVDANLQQLRIWSDKGWLRSPASVQSVERAALRRIDESLARQAASHVGASVQPRVNSAEAIRRMARPVVVAAGIRNPQFRFQLSDRIVIE